MGRTTLIMRGGGLKGLAFAGAIEILEREYHFTQFVGTSAGAITAVFLAAGYDCCSLKELLEKTEFDKFKDCGLFRSLLNLFFRGGLYPGDRLRDWVECNLQAKLNRQKINLADLPMRAICFAVEPRFGTVVFDSQGANRDTEAAIAVRVSASIPFFFKPLELNSRRTYDGGLVKNFPIHAALQLTGGDFVALHLGPNKPAPAERRWLPLELLQIWLNQDESKLVDEFKNRIVRIDPTPVRTTSFKLTSNEKEFLLAEGRAAALEFLLACGSPKVTAEEVEIRRKEANRLRGEIIARRRRGRVRFRACIACSLVLFLAVAGFAYRHTKHSLLSFGRLFRRADRIMVAIPSSLRSNEYYKRTLCLRNEYKATELCQAEEEKENLLTYSAIMLPGMEQMLDSISSHNPGAVVDLAVSWRERDGQIVSLDGYDTVIIGGPVATGYFYRVREKLLEQLPDDFKALPFDFSKNIYDNLLSHERYGNDTKNGIVVGYDSRGKSLAESEAIQRHCQGDKTTYYPSIASGTPSSPHDALCFGPENRTEHRETVKLLSDKTEAVVVYDVDYGFFLVGPNPFDRSRRLIMIAGTHTEATARGLQYIFDQLTQEDINQLAHAAEHVSSNLDYLSGLFKVTRQRESKLKLELVRTVRF